MDWEESVVLIGARKRARTAQRGGTSYSKQRGGYYVVSSATGSDNPINAERFVRLIVVLLLCSCLSCQSSSKFASSSRAPQKPAMCDEYLDLITTYSIYAKTIWHDDPAGAGGY